MLSTTSFDAVTDFFHQVSGIRLTPAKRPLVMGRLQKLASARGAPNLDDYIEHLMTGSDPDEMVRVVDSLTTNETYFFREPQHFDVLADLVRQRTARREPFRVWSAASSSGEEAYSIAMLLADHLGLQGWEVIGTDLSTAVVARAQRALYPLERAQHMPPAYLKRWCRKGLGNYAGQLLVCQELRERVHFQCANLTQPLPELGLFDVIFLRNVLIYFDNPGKSDIVLRVLKQLRPGGLLFSGHAESLTQLGLPLRTITSAVYARSDKL
jgi:chemotaxis protein methyltransferase CheR